MIGDMTLHNTACLAILTVVWWLLIVDALTLYLLATEPAAGRSSGDRRRDHLLA